MCYIFKPTYEEEVVEESNEPKVDNANDEIEVEEEEKEKLPPKAPPNKNEEDCIMEEVLKEMEITEADCAMEEEGKTNKQLVQNNQAFVSHEGVVLLGIPIGTKKFILDFVIQSLKEKTNACKRLVELPTQIAYHMLRLVIAPTPVFLVRALGDDFDLLREWDKKIEREVFRLANQMHDYITFKGMQDDRISKGDLEELLQEQERDKKVKLITPHSKLNFQIAESLIYLSSREGGLGVMLTERMAKEAFLASSINSLAMLNSRAIDHILSEKTKLLIKNNLEIMEESNPILTAKLKEDSIDKISPEETQGLQRTLTLAAQGKMKAQVEDTLKKEEQVKRLAPLFEDHQGDHANRVLIKPPTLTKTYVINDDDMQEIISQTLLLPNDLGIKSCKPKSKSMDGHQCIEANHMNACSFTGGVGTRHTQAKHSLEKILRICGIGIKNEQLMAEQGKSFRADIYVNKPEQPVLIDVTCVQTSQNHKTLAKAMDDAYERKVNTYNSMEESCKLRKEFKEGVKLIPVVIGPRGQFQKKSWQDLTQLLGIESAKASRQESMGVAPILRNSLDPEKASLAISLLKALAFRVAVNTANNARKWQALQRERWNQNERASRVTIERPKRG